MPNYIEESGWGDYQDTGWPLEGKKLPGETAGAADRDYGNQGYYGLRDYGEGYYGPETYAREEWTGMRDYWRGGGKAQERPNQPGSIWHDREIYGIGRDFGRGGEPYGWESYQGASRRNGPADLSNVRSLGPVKRHALKGPRSYQRPDKLIEEDVNDRLADSPAVDASDIAVAVEKGEVTLSGSVYDKRMKRSAERLADSIYGVKDVHNHLKIRYVDNPPPSG